MFTSHGYAHIIVRVENCKNCFGGLHQTLVILYATLARFSEPLSESAQKIPATSTQTPTTMGE